ncbi:hypothetical protein ScPMuIL_017358 [Solemya velum]
MASLLRYAVELHKTKRLLTLDFLCFLYNLKPPSLPGSRSGTLGACRTNLISNLWLQLHSTTLEDQFSLWTKSVARIPMSRREL